MPLRLFTCILFLTLSFTSLYAQHMPHMRGFMKLAIGMPDDKATELIDKLWTEKDLKDTGPMRVYVIGKPDDDETLSGAFRLLVYNMGNSLSNKEARFSVKKQHVRNTLDSIRNVLEKEYGKPGIDSTMNLIGFEGSIKVYSWSFPSKTGDEDLYRVDLAAYKLKIRNDYTILAAVFTRRYQIMLPARNYLHY